MKKGVTEHIQHIIQSNKQDLAYFFFLLELWKQNIKFPFYYLTITVVLVETII